MLSGFVSAYHPVTPGLARHLPMLLSFIGKIELYLSCEKNKNKQK